MSNGRRRIRTRASAQRYVAGCVAAMLEADFSNASEWMHADVGIDGGNLDGPKSEALVHQAARELARQLHDFSKGKR